MSDEQKAIDFLTNTAKDAAKGLAEESEVSKANACAGMAEATTNAANASIRMACSITPCWFSLSSRFITL